MNFFIEQNGKSIGPVKLDELKMYTITANTLLWQEGTTNWVKASELELVKPFIVSLPPLLPSPKIQKLSGEFDVLYPKEKRLINMGIAIMIISLALSFLFRFITTNESNIDSEQDNTVIIVFFSILGLLIRIMATVSIVEAAKRLNRDEGTWGIVGFLFPGITLIVLGNQYKLRH